MTFYLDKHWLLLGQKYPNESRANILDPDQMAQNNEQLIWIYNIHP
jgi:hypothetical protein